MKLFARLFTKRPSRSRSKLRWIDIVPENARTLAEVSDERREAA